MSGCTPIDAVRQAVRPELTWWRQEMSNRAQERVVEVGHEWSGSN